MVNFIWGLVIGALAAGVTVYFVVRNNKNLAKAEIDKIPGGSNGPEQKAA